MWPVEIECAVYSRDTALFGFLVGRSAVALLKRIVAAVHDGCINKIVTIND